MPSVRSSWDAWTRHAQRLLGFPLVACHCRAGDQLLRAWRPRSLAPTQADRRLCWRRPIKVFMRRWRINSHFCDCLQKTVLSNRPSVCPSVCWTSLSDRCFKIPTFVPWPFFVFFFFLFWFIWREGSKDSGRVWRLGEGRWRKHHG